MKYITKTEYVNGMNALYHRVDELEILEAGSGQAEIELREERDRAQKYLDIAGIIFTVIDADQRVSMINKKGCEILGSEERDIIGKNWFDTFIPKRIREEVRAVFKKLIKGEVEPVEYYKNPILTKSGQEKMISWHNTVLRDEDGGRIRAVLSAGEDITEQKKIEEELRRYQFQLEELVRKRTAELMIANEKLLKESAERQQAEERIKLAYLELDRIFNTAADGMCVIDKEFRVLRINDTFCKLLGISKEEAMNKPCYEIFRYSLCDSLCCPLSMVINGEASTESYVEVHRKDGTKVPCIVTTVPFRKPDGGLIGVVENFKDLTEHIRAEEELLRAQKIESLGVMAGGIAHGFNNLLTAILGNLSLAKLYIESNGRIFSSITEAEKASLQAKNLAKQLLTFSRGGEPIKREISLSGFLKDTACLTLKESKAKCKLVVQHDLWWAEIDEGQINQAINNLVMNADQAMPDGGVIEVRAENVVVSKGSNLPLKEGKYVKVSVKDQGVGISGEHLKRLFDPYFTTKPKGSGLGLAIAFSIIKRHGGHITVDTKVDVGSTFSLYLPAFERQIFYPEEVEEVEFYPGRGKVLFMDDQPEVRDIAGDMLQYIGYEVGLAADGDEAVETYKEAKESGQPFDAVILDLVVPGGAGGEEAIKMLHEVDPEVKAIVSSGYSDDPVMSTFKEHGFSGVIAKPYEIKELSLVLHKIVKS